MRRLGNLSTYQDANHLYTRIATERTRKGLITNLFSPVERRKRDSALLIRPGLLQILPIQLSPKLDRYWLVMTVLRTT